MSRLTERAVLAAKPRRSKYELTCSVMRGFVLRVLPTGKKVYYVRVRQGGGDKRHRIGDSRDVSFDEAAAQARVLLYPPREGTAIELEPPAPRPQEQTRAYTVGEFAARYLEQHVDKRLKPATRTMYRFHLKHVLGAFANKPLDTITREQIELWHASMRDRPSAANNALRVLRGLFTKALDWGVLGRAHGNPTKGVRMFRENRRERFLTPQERARIDRALREGARTRAGRKGALLWSTIAALRLLTLTGMRRAEVLGLEWSMVDFRHRCFRLPDSKVGQRVIPIGAPVIELLRDLERRRQPGIPYVVYSTVAKPIDPAALGKSWRTIRERIELVDVRIHDLRHSAASDALMSGVPLAVVGKILGHRKPSTTARYAHISDHVLRDAVETMTSAITATRATSKSR